MMTNKYDTVIYTGLTNALVSRTAQHKSLQIAGFSSRYKTTKLVYYEHFDHIEDAIRREKQIKSWSREKKEELIDSMNPEWVDLYPELVEED
jgi:putative endonuclease